MCHCWRSPAVGKIFGARPQCPTRKNFGACATTCALGGVSIASLKTAGSRRGIGVRKNTPSSKVTCHSCSTFAEPIERLGLPEAADLNTNDSISRIRRSGRPCRRKIGRYVTQPPLIAIGILSPETTPREMQEGAAEYRSFGIEHIWIVGSGLRLV